jgi:hypothetical protein
MPTAPKSARMKVSAPVEKLIRSMLNTIDNMGCSPTARLDARYWGVKFRRQAKRLGFE